MSEPCSNIAPSHPHPQQSRRKSSGGGPTRDDEGDDLGILVGEKKARTVEDWLLRSTPIFWQTIEKHWHQLPLRHSAWSEKIFQIRQIWVGTETPTDPSAITDVDPPAGEPSVTVDWRLPLSQEAHNALARRICLDYTRATAVVPNPEKKKQYRKTQAKPSPIFKVQ